jgi:cobalt-zinc-cadmium efflux system membrane fusion protein
MRTSSLIAIALLLASCSPQRQESSAGPEQTDASGNGRIVEMKKAAQAQVGLSAIAATVENLAEYLNVTGTVQPTDSRVARVRPLARGRIDEVLVRVGDRVRQGQPLARFDNVEAGGLAAEAQAAQAELRKMKVARQAAARQVERNRRLSELGAVARKDYEASLADEQAAAEAIEAQQSLVAGLLARLRRFGVSPDREGLPISDISAPISGIVIAVATAPGEVIEAEKELFTIADLSTVWVQAEVYEKDLGRLRTGQTAFVQVDTYGDRRFTGKVTYVADVVDPKTRTVKVRCEVPNSSALLKLDMFATINLPTVTQRRAVAVPESAIQQLNGRPIVFVRRSAETFEVRPVTLGMTANGLAEIASGIAAGEMVAVQGAFHLKSVLLESQIANEE